VTPNEELNLTGGLRQQLARAARELHLVGSADRLTPARYADLNELFAQIYT
jgi:hypothetical protein